MAKGNSLYDKARRDLSLAQKYLEIISLQKDMHISYSNVLLILRSNNPSNFYSNKLKSSLNNVVSLAAAEEVAIDKAKNIEREVQIYEN